MRSVALTASYRVHCSPEEMVVEVSKPKDVTAIYLEHLKRYPGKECEKSLVK